MANTKTTYRVSSQMSNGAYEDNAQYDNFDHARIHYDAFNIYNSNLFLKQVHCLNEWGEVTNTTVYAVQDDTKTWAKMNEETA